MPIQYEQAGIQYEDALYSYLGLQAYAGNTNFPASLGAVSFGVPVYLDTTTTFGGQATFWGDVGIGTSSPIAKLQVADGAIIASGNAAWGSINGTAATHNAAWNVSNGTNSWPILSLYDNTTEVVRVSDGGNVGIGTASPAAKLDVAGDLRVGGQLVANSSGQVLYA